MAKEKDLTGMKDSKLMKSLGVTEMKQTGGQVELFIDPSKLPKSRQKVVGAGLARAVSSTMTSNPFAPGMHDVASNGSAMTIQQKIKLANAWFDKDPLVGKTIELMKTIANEDFKNECSDPKIKKFYDDWGYRVDLEMVLGWIFLEYFRSGNVPVMREMVPVDKKGFGFPAPPYAGGGSEVETDKSGVFIKGEAAAKKDYSKKMIPGAYTVLNPLFVSVESINPYGDKLTLNLGKDQKFELTDPNEVKSIFVRNMPEELKQKALKEDTVALSQDKVKRILRMRQPYEPYGKIMMERAFDALYEKAKLREMDLAMVNSVINQIVKVTIGNDQYPATQAQLKRLADAFQNVGKSQVIFWNHTLNIEVIRPDTKVLNNDKYVRINDDIRDAFGLSPVLNNEGGGSANFATSYLSLKVFIANLKEARRDVLRWLRMEYEDIAKAMNFDTYPEPTFGQMSLTDEISEKQIIMQLVDRGIISYETAQSRLGYDPQIELQRRKEEKKYTDAGVLGIPKDPMLESPQGAMNKIIQKDDKKKVDGEDQKASQMEREKTKHVGRPNGIPNRQVKPKRTADQGRPSTPSGSYPKQRKIAKIKGQADETEVS